MDKTEQEWLLNLIKDDISIRPKQEKPKVKLPNSQFQELVVDFYKTLKDAESPDAFDNFYDNCLKNYNKMSKFIEFLESIAKALQIIVEETNDKKQKIQKLLFALTEKKLQECESTLKVVKETIESKYPNLIYEDYNEEKYEVEYEEMVEKTLNDIKEQLEQNKENFKEHIKRVETAKTDIEKIAEELNEIVYLGSDIWELLLYSSLSPYCPKIKINSLDTRPNLHLMLVGDISTAKSKIMKILERISPKSEWFTKATEPSFEGIANRNGIEQGIIDYANNGSLLISELTEKHISTIRNILDNDKIKIIKAGNEKVIDLNITIQVAENPKSDFFINEVNLREQISFSDGLLSRFDILVPLTTTSEKNKFLLSKLNIFGESPNKIDLENIAQILRTKSIGMREVKGVELNDKQKEMVKDAFLKHNIELKNRPLLVLRDFESLARLVNVIVVSNFYNRKNENGIVKAEDKDIEKAIMLWETLIDLRKTLFTKDNRITIVSIEDKILMEIAKYGGCVECTELERIIVNNGICSRATFYRKIERMNGKKIMVDGNKNRKIILI